MKFTLFLLSAAAMVNAASSTDPVGLGTAGDYAILSKAGISTTPGSQITGSIAVSPIAATAITGFGLSAPPGEYSTSDLVIGGGQVKAANYAVPTPSKLTTAVGDMEIAYADAAGRSTGVIIGSNSIQDFNAEYGKFCVGVDGPSSGTSNCVDSGNNVYDNPDPFLNLGDGEIGGLKLAPGVYTFDRQVNISAGGGVTFVGDEDDVFIIQTSKGVMQADSTHVILEQKDSGSFPKAENIFWSVAGEVNIGTDSTMKGVLLVATKVAMKTNSALNGRILAQTAVTLDKNAITQPS